MTDSAVQSRCDPTTQGMLAMVDHLETTHHAYLRDELPRLDELAHHVAAHHGDTRPELVKVSDLVSSLRRDLEPHMMKEERVLFPMVRDLAAARDQVPAFHCGTLRNPIGVMVSEHDRTADLLARLEMATCRYALPDDACPSLRSLYEGLARLDADTRLHMHEENDVLFPAIIAAEAELSRGRA